MHEEQDQQDQETKPNEDGTPAAPVDGTTVPPLQDQPAPVEEVVVEDEDETKDDGLKEVAPEAPQETRETD